MIPQAQFLFVVYSTNFKFKQQYDTKSEKRLYYRTKTNTRFALTNKSTLDSFQFLHMHQILRLHV